MADLPRESAAETSQSRRRWLTIEVCALVFVAIIAAFHPWANYRLRAPGLAGSSMMPLGATLALFTLAGINALLQRRGKAPWFTPGESLALFLIILAGGWSACWGLVAPTIPLMTAPFFLATPQNEWGRYILPYLPQWLLGPTEEPYLSAFYVGLKPGVAFPWKLWAAPAFAWSVFTVAMILFVTGLSGILSRRWIEHDRFTFPHAQVLIGMARGFLSNKLFWIGAAIAAAIPFWNINQRFFPIFRRIPTYLTGGADGVYWLEGASRIAFPLAFGLLGLFYFVHADIVLSTVIFFFVLALEDYFLVMAGIKFTNDELYFYCPSPINWQMIGALFTLVILGLWAGRSSIYAYAASAFKGKEDGSWLSPRATVAALFGGGTLMALFMLLAGLSPGAVLGFMSSAGLSFIGVARMTVESGVQINPSVDPLSITTMALGTKLIAPAGFAFLALWFGWSTSMSENMMTKMIHGEQMNRQHRFPRGTYAMVIAAAAIGTAAAIYSTAVMGYKYGANAFFDDWTFTWHPRMAFDQMTVCAKTYAGPDLPRIMFMAIGGAAMAALMFLRSNVVGWFLHPIGFLLGHSAQGVAGHPDATELVFIGIVAWSSKKLILLLGGAEAFEKYRPFFAGLVIGAVLPGAYSLLVTLLAGPQLR